MTQSMSQMTGCKLPRHLENPVDDAIMVAVEPLLEPLHRWGVTPNMVTWASIAAATAALVFFATNRPWAAAAMWTINYVCDTVDGFMARRYHMETVFGSALDHASDVAAFVGLMGLVLTRAAGRPAWPLFVEVALLLGAYVHLSCQEKDTSHIAFDGIDGTTCPDKTWLAWTRWVGTGTLTLWHLVLIFIYARA